MPTLVATLSQAVLMLVGRKKAAYRKGLDSDPFFSFSLQQPEVRHDPACLMLGVNPIASDKLQAEA